MIIKSEVTGEEYEVGTYNGESGKVGIQHESLHDILVNKLPDNVTYNTRVITATVDYCAAECVISDMNGRKVQAFNDVSIPNGLFIDDEQRKFVSAHPITQVIQSAEDTAVREYLKWPRYFTKEGTGGTVIGEVEIPPEAMENQTATEEPGEGAGMIEDSDTFTGMNPPEESDCNESNAETTAADTVESQSDPASGTASKDPETELDSDYTLEELGKMKPPVGKYADKTFDEIWAEKKSWFDYIVTTSKNKKYDLAREYYRKKNAQA